VDCRSTDEASFTMDRSIMFIPKLRKNRCVILAPIPMPRKDRKSSKLRPEDRSDVKVVEPRGVEPLTS
jgi:hypothetical protein